MWILKISELINLCKKSKNCEIVLLQNFFLKVNRKGIYFIWLRLKCRKEELKQQVKVSLKNYVVIFRHDCRCNIRFIFTNTKPGNFRISKNQSISNTPSTLLHFSFSMEGLSNLNCLQGRVRKNRPHKTWNEKHVTLLVLRIWGTNCFKVHVRLIS